MKKLLIIGSHERMWDDIHSLDDYHKYDVYACNEAAVMYSQHIDVLVTLHPDNLYFGKEWVQRRAAINYTNNNYQIISNWMVGELLLEGRPALVMKAPTVSGTTVLFAVMCGIWAGYDDIAIAGAPMEDSQYHDYRKGWEEKVAVLRGTMVRSMSGWTKQFLESIELQTNP
jgi:hypothetical protein